MSRIFRNFPILHVLCAIAVGLSVSLKNHDASGQGEIIDDNNQSFLPNSNKALPTYRRIDSTKLEKLLRNRAKSNDPKKIDVTKSTTKSGRIAGGKLFPRGRKMKIVSSTESPKELSSRKNIDKSDDNVRKELRLKVFGENPEKNGSTDLIEMQRKPIGVEQRAKRKKKKRIRIDRLSKIEAEPEDGENFYNFSSHSSATESSESLIFEEHPIIQQLPVEIPCRPTPINESSSSLRILFHVPRVRKVQDCQSRKSRVIGEQRFREPGGQSSALAIRVIDRGHTELIHEYENERSMDLIGVEYVHPEGHKLSTEFPPRQIHPRKSSARNNPTILKSASNFRTSRIASSDQSNLGRKRKKKKIFDTRKIKSPEVPDDVVTSSTIVDTDFADYSASKKKRDTDDALIDVDYQRALSRVRQFRDGIGSDFGINENPPKINDVESWTEKIREHTERPAAPVQSTTTQSAAIFRNVEEKDTAEAPWPLVPGPISCDLDFQLKPSFVAKLGEFDFVVSVQRQQNPDVPAEHACTGVVYNPRFVIIAPHCLHDMCDNYGLTVTSTDDLCTIDEIIQVDYIIEHENYDGETRQHDIALIKLKSEIHKKPATFSKDDGTPEKFYYAVGFGELMWKSYPTKISKLLQKMPVQRYQRASRDASGTLDITTSNLDLTGAFRGDFGGALVNPRGEFVGLKSKLMKKSIEYEVYTRVRAYVPWIESMVALHGSW